MKLHGDLHDFMQWKGPISPTPAASVSSALAIFVKSPNRACTSVTRSTAIRFSSILKKSMEIQYDLGSDIVMIFDECTPYPADWDYAKTLHGDVSALGEA